MRDRQKVSLCNVYHGNTAHATLSGGNLPLASVAVILPRRVPYGTIYVVAAVTTCFQPRL